MSHDEFCLNKDEPTMLNCALCAVLERLRASLWADMQAAEQMAFDEGMEKGFVIGYQKGKDEEMIHSRMLGYDPRATDYRP